MKNFAITINPYSNNLPGIISLLEELHKEKGLNIYCFEDQKILFPETIQSFETVDATKLDCILVFGGDGTILRSKNYSLKYDAPILGVNLGRLGFLSDISLPELKKVVDLLLLNKFKIQSRMLLKCIVKRHNRTVYTDQALNDVVVYKGVTPKLIDIKIFSNKRYIIDTRCDGIVVSTPTGSTAYSLSAGGPILSPIMDAIILTPLNPHILSVRPMIFPASDNVSLRINSSHAETILQLDGENKFQLFEKDEILVTSANEKVNFIKLTNKTFYQILRKKMHLGKI